ncbi:SdpI family protein [Roseinatronobacter monicus]|uniref:SdpI family protein n=1 Tax=Roseinatronobacter monicus TaxID=393481 RepID=UPI002482DEB9|nr:SdpI family protein [Roseinatronobacter monicus]
MCDRTFRTGRTLSDEAVWYAVNANVGWTLVLSGLVSAAIIWRVFALDLNLSVKCLTATAPLIGSAILAVIVGTLS